jgi:hypothetical protein
LRAQHFGAKSGRFLDVRVVFFAQKSASKASSEQFHHRCVSAAFTLHDTYGGRVTGIDRGEHMAIGADDGERGVTGGRQLLSRVGVLRILVLLMLLGGVITGFVVQDEIGLAEIRATFAAAGPWAPLLFIAVYTVATIVYLPGPLVTMTGGMVFGAWWGTLYSVTGAVTPHLAKKPANSKNSAT